MSLDGNRGEQMTHNEMVALDNLLEAYMKLRFPSCPTVEWEDDPIAHAAASVLNALEDRPPSRPTMTRDLMFGFMAEHSAKCIELARRKNADYSGASDDPFFNLRRGGEFGVAVRLDDKVSRLLSLLKPGATAQVKGESVDDTLDDIVNYALLLRAMREANK